MRGRDRCRCGSALALHGCGFCSGLLRLDRGVGQTIAALDQIFEPLGETCCRCPVDDIVMDLAESLAIACTDLCSSTAFATQAMMKAVNDRASLVFALWSRRNVRALVTSTSIKPCILGVRWTERRAAAIKRLLFGYETIL